MKNCYALLQLAAIAVLLAGCAQQPLQPIDNWDAHKRAAVDLDHWQLNGKVGARLPENSGSARLRWEQEGDHDYSLNLSGPFGQGRVIIEGHSQGVRLRQGGEPPMEATTAEELMWHATGWTFPVEHLIYWVRGIPDPNYPYHIAEHTPEGFLQTLTQGGWTLNYNEYQATEAMPLPRRIIATRDDIRLTLIIYQWDL